MTHASAYVSSCYASDDLWGEIRSKHLRNGISPNPDLLIHLMHVEMLNGRLEPNERENRFKWLSKLI